MTPRDAYDELVVDRQLDAELVQVPDEELVQVPGEELVQVPGEELVQVPDEQLVQRHGEGFVEGLEDPGEVPPHWRSYQLPY
ncbi:hypothetical protein LTR36_009801 [Oleoguttula mirabilis]|uniref:Uncharacterized protein n=1 Tax=Oleoguttula mirabilis TaxID=1507867 RepID=A0AAV9J5U1_9PEZI|nr:hypothetical protein LTR36_009801 [Oleoguttula mirabilis]